MINQWKYIKNNNLHTVNWCKAIILQCTRNHYVVVSQLNSHLPTQSVLTKPLTIFEEIVHYSLPFSTICCLCISLLSLELQLSRWCDSIKWCTPFLHTRTYCSVCSKPGPGFPTPYVVISLSCSVASVDRGLFALLILV